MSDPSKACGDRTTTLLIGNEGRFASTVVYLHGVTARVSRSLPWPEARLSPDESACHTDAVGELARFPREFHAIKQGTTVVAAAWDEAVASV